MTGVASGRRGEGFGEENGDPTVCDFVLASAGGVGPKPGGTEGVAVELLGELLPEARGVAARWIQGAGDRERATCTLRAGGGEVVLSSVELFHCHKTPSTASSSALPLSEVGLLLSSSSKASVLASSSSSLLSRIGRHRS